MKIVLATGVPQLDDAIEDSIKEVDVVGSVLFREAVIDIVERKKPNAIILSELLDGTIKSREVVLKLRTRFPETRIIYIMKDENAQEESFLYQLSVFDILPSKFGVPELKKALFSPKEFKDVAGRMEELKSYQKPSDLIDETTDLSGFTHINGDGYEEIPTQGGNAGQPYQQIATFWSTRDEAGKTFSAINSALLLATNKSLKILLIDYSLENPSVHLQFRVADENRNLSAIVDDAQNGVRINKNTLDDYLITHPVYTNLKILPGYILKMKRAKDEELITIFDDIIEAAERSNFSTILVDVDSNLHSPVTVHILQESTRILLHVAENPGSLNALRRVFDSEIGPFVEKLIDKKKIVPIITHSIDENRSKFKLALEKTIELRVGSIIERSDEILTSFFIMQPIFSKKPGDELYNSFIFICNLIHPNIFNRPMTGPKKKNKNEKKGLLGGLFGKSNKKK